MTISIKPGKQGQPNFLYKYIFPSYFMLKEDGKKEEENEDKLGSSLTINPLQQDSKTQITK